MLVFPETYKKVAARLADDVVVLVKGRAEALDEGKSRLLATDVMPLEQARLAEARFVTIRVPVTALGPGQGRAAARHPGLAPRRLPGHPRDGPARARTRWPSPPARTSACAPDAGAARGGRGPPRPGLARPRPHQRRQRESADGRRLRGAAPRAAEAHRGARAFPGIPSRSRRRTLRRARRARDIYAKLTPWQKTQVARHPNRPVHARLRRRAVHRVRRAPRRPALRRRPRAGGGLRPLQGPAGGAWSATRRAATPSRRSTATSACPSPRATARRCA